MRRILLCSALALIVILLGLAGLAWYYGPKIVYYGAYFDDTSTTRIAPRVPGAERVEYRMGDGTRLRGWLWDRGPRASLVVVYGGNNMNVGDLAGLAWLDRRRSYLMVNHRGFGESEGEPSEEQLVADAREVLRRTRRQLDYPAHTALIGYSLGTGVATQVAAAEKVDALILACPFDSVLAVGCHHVPLLPKLIPMDHFRSDLAAPKVRCPVTIFLGERDTVVPPAHTERLCACFTATKATLHRVPCGHANIFDQRRLRRALSDALEDMEADDRHAASWDAPRQRR